MNEFLLNLLSAALIPILGVLTTYAVNLIKLKINDLSERVNDGRLNKYLAIAEDAVTASVNAVSQMYVDALKKENAFTAETQKEAFNKAKDAALAIMGDKAVEAIKCGLDGGEFETWLTAKIETAVRAK
jgi:hypothetical protein